MDTRFAIAWALSSSLWAGLLTLVYVARYWLVAGELLREALAEERRQYSSYRRLFAPPSDWSDSRAITVLYREGKGLSYATGMDLAKRGFTPAQISPERASEPPPLPSSERKWPSLDEVVNGTPTRRIPKT